MPHSVALIGFGEAGATFAGAGLWGSRAIAFDTAPERAAVMAKCGVVAAQSAAQALTGAPLVLCVVTADQALAAARAYAAELARGAIWCDMNSVAPETKRQASRQIAEAGGRYVDVAVLAPVDPAKLKVPLLLAGDAAEDASAHLQALGFSNLRIVGAEIGRASAIKMIRSVMVKGIEALTDEMIAAARAAGVTEEVLNSLDASERAMSWHQKADYNLERMARHGLRRAAEMQEAAKTLKTLGINPLMTEGTVIRQREAGEASKDRDAGAVT